MPIELLHLAHIGIRVSDFDRSLAFYRHLGFEPVYEDPNDAVVILKNEKGVEINFIVNAEAAAVPCNVLMDVEAKHPGFTHVALEIASYQEVLDYCTENGIEVSGGPVDLGDGVSLFIRDPDRNVIELRQNGTRIGRAYQG
ncbi:MAG: VOC family protein [Proteobacteria bacterium]|nr:VOC family protein [Pseudomonadota bacterium]